MIPIRMRRTICCFDFVSFCVLIVCERERGVERETGSVFGGIKEN